MIDEQHRQLELSIVPATELRAGDTLLVGFAFYGDVPCPIIQAPVARGKLLDIGVRIGNTGPYYCAVVRADSMHTVLR